LTSSRSAHAFANAAPPRKSPNFAPTAAFKKTAEDIGKPLSQTWTIYLMNSVILFLPPLN
jgi:hypothetical protein